jgi:hypothetical protein
MTGPGLSGDAGLFGDEGRRLLDEQHPHLFPATVLPPFRRLLWAALALLAIGVAVVLVAISGRLP